MNEMNIVEYLFIIVCLNHRLGAATLDCDFDRDFCEWRQDKYDDFNWKREDYGTPSSSTGPTSDHTTGYGHYIYIEASGKDKGEKARIVGPTQLLGQYCLTFWYNMYGRDIGALNIYLATSGNETVIFNEEKDIGNPVWWNSGLSIKATESFQIIFEGVIGNNSKGDIAIDDIAIDIGLCSIDCNFDTNFCGWYSDSSKDFTWERQSSGYTGPASDHTSGYGYYIYIEATGKSEGEKARIISPMQRSGQYCLTFWYNMYGKDIGALNIYLATRSNETMIFNKEKDIGNRRWWNSGLSITATKTFQIIFEGVIGYDSKGDIAIDDINMDIGLCSLDCNFDTNFCGWYFDPSSDFAWERKPYATSSPSTGPTSDHTTGNDYYIYIEATWNDEGEKSRLVSPVQLPGQYCLTFWYSMYGKDIGSLNVYKAMNGIETVIFTKDEDIGKPGLWKAVLTIMANETFQFVFEGVIGNGYWGDIAIDDISLNSGLCSLDCDFDINFCNWMQSHDDDFDWNHATSNSGNGFIYTKAGYENGTAMMISPLHNAGKYCLSFFYFMVGWKYQTLQIQLWKRNGSKIVLDSLQSHENHKRIFISSRHLFQIVFEGKVHTLDTNNGGEIRMDDVTISSCHDCVDPTPNHGTINSTNYEYGSVIKIQCEHGYILKGKSVIVCETMGIWSGTAECILYDCGNLTIQNGTFITSNGTTYGQIGKHVCDAGFILIGEQNIRCTVNGWSDISTYCKIVDIQYSEPDSSSLVAVYVITPVIVLIVAAMIIVVYLRRRHPSCIKILKTDKNSRNEPNDVSLSGQSHSNNTYSNEVDHLDEEYATIAEEQDRNDGLHTVHYTNIKKTNTKKLDETKSDGVNKTAGESLQNEFKMIDALSTKDLNARSKSNEEQDYDTACTGKINSKPLNHDDYSHLGDLEMEYQHPFNLDMQADMQTNTEYSHIDGVNTNPSLLTHVEGNNSNVYQNSIENEKKKILGEHIQKIKDSKDHESDYYNVGTDVEDTDTEGCFVLQDEDRNNESDGFEKHEYFILKNM